MLMSLDEYETSKVLGKEMLLDYIWMSPDVVSVGEEGEGHSM